MRHPILDIWTDAISRENALQKVSDFIDTGTRAHTIFATNPEKNYSVPKDPLLYESFKNADLLLPDGIGMVMAARILHCADIERVPGCEFMQDICRLAAKKGYKVFLYGAREEVNLGAVRILEERLPGLTIAGRCNGYWPAEDMAELVEKINASKAEILFLALGSPRQEKWFVEHRDQLKHIRVEQGIGGTLDVITGNVKRAPDFFCRFGLEWFYRLVSEPKRLKRQRVLPLFVCQVLAKKFFTKSQTN